MFHTFIKKSLRRHFVPATLALLFLLCVCGFPSQAAAVKGGIQQQTYNSPEAAVKALIHAMKAKDIEKIKGVLGPEGKDVISSGDKTADNELLERFLNLYDEKSRIERIGNSKAVLLVGEKDWPMPIPIAKKGKRWLFDTKSGKEEIVNRRIGRNELAVIKVCEAYVDAQQEFALMDTDGDGLFEYARKFRSSPGKKDGLYWETREGEELSPLGPFAAKARSEGYLKESSDQSQPYYGYYYKILTAQGKNAKGGAFDYVVNGNMIGGFALIAYPAQYGNSGIMTFIVNQDGVVYQKNLGRNTIKIAREMTLFDPDESWKKVKTLEPDATPGNDESLKVQGG